ncbi:sulfotransferase domain-containing protein [Ekhidna sp.]|uniref:sulfotransferase domain-containing protein n=1 Tax=Ekhidna sp. TaxID=2608089 RepID=UPI003BAA0AE2
MSQSNLIIAGPPKTGTTSIFDWLAQHPDVCEASKKETGFFSDAISPANRSCNFNTHGIEAYIDLFHTLTDEKVLLEATPEYIYTKTAINNIPRLFKKKLVLFIYRDPVDRIVSEYKFHTYKTKKFSGSLKEFLDRDVIKNKIDFAPFIQKWITATNDIRIIEFDDLKKHPKKIMKRLAKELEISVEFYENFDFQVRNESLALRNKWLHDVSLKFSKIIPQNLKNTLSPFYFKFNASKIPDLSKEDLKLKEALKIQFQSHRTDFLKMAEPYLL